MTQVILAFEDKTLTRALQTKIVQKYGLESAAFQDSTQVISMIGFLPDIQMIIASEKLHAKICEFLIKKGNEFNKIHVLVLGKHHTPYPFIASISPALPVDKIVHYGGFLLNLEETSGIEAPVGAPVMEETQEDVEEDAAEDAAEEKTTVFTLPNLKAETPVPEALEKTLVTEYIAINMKFFMHLKKINVDFDIYSRVKKHDEYEYNLKIAAGALVSDIEIERFKVRGGREFFVKKENQAKAQEYFGTLFLNRFKDPNLSINNRMILNSESFEILMEVFKDSSFTKYSIEIIKELVKSFQILLKSNEPLTAFFNGLKQNELSYVYVHSYLSCLMIFKIIDEFPWKKDQSLNKVLYMSLFHDLCLHNSRLVKIHHNYKEESGKLTDSEKLILNSHADAAALILETIVKAPKELTALVREHHGLKQGHGFIDDLSISINPLSMAYIVTEEFVTKYLEFWEASNKDVVSEFVKISPDALFDELSAKYNKLTYADVVLALKKQFTKVEDTKKAL